MQKAPARKSLEVCFAQLGVEALYVPNQGQAHSIRALVKQPDHEVTFHETRIINATHVFEILQETCPQPLRGDRIQLGDETFTIQHVETLDPLRLVWTVGAAKA